VCCWGFVSAGWSSATGCAGTESLLRHTCVAPCCHLCGCDRLQMTSELIWAGLLVTSTRFGCACTLFVVYLLWLEATMWFLHGGQRGYAVLSWLGAKGVSVAKAFLGCCAVLVGHAQLQDCHVLKCAAKTVYLPPVVPGSPVHCAQVHPTWNTNVPSVKQLSTLGSLAGCLIICTVFSSVVQAA